MNKNETPPLPLSESESTELDHAGILAPLHLITEIGITMDHTRELESHLIAADKLRDEYGENGAYPTAIEGLYRHLRRVQAIVDGEMTTNDIVAYLHQAAPSRHLEGVPTPEPKRLMFPPNGLGTSAGMPHIDRQGVAKLFEQLLREYKIVDTIGAVHRPLQAVYSTEAVGTLAMSHQLDTLDRMREWGATLAKQLGKEGLRRLSDVFTDRVAGIVATYSKDMESIPAHDRKRIGMERFQQAIVEERPLIEATLSEFITDERSLMQLFADHDAMVSYLASRGWERELSWQQVLDSHLELLVPWMRQHARYMMAQTMMQVTKAVHSDNPDLTWLESTTDTATEHLHLVQERNTQLQEVLDEHEQYPYMSAVYRQQVHNEHSIVLEKIQTAQRRLIDLGITQESLEQLLKEGPASATDLAKIELALQQVNETVNAREQPFLVGDVTEKESQVRIAQGLRHGVLRYIEHSYEPRIVGIEPQREWLKQRSKAFISAGVANFYERAYRMYDKKLPNHLIPHHETYGFTQLKKTIFSALQHRKVIAPSPFDTVTVTPTQKDTEGSVLLMEVEEPLPQTITLTDCGGLSYTLQKPSGWQDVGTELEQVWATWRMIVNEEKERIQNGEGRWLQDQRDWLMESTKSSEKSAQRAYEQSLLPLHSEMRQRAVEQEYKEIVQARKQFATDPQAVGLSLEQYLMIKNSYALFPPEEVNTHVFFDVPGTAGVTVSMAWFIPMNRSYYRNVFVDASFFRMTHEQGCWKFAQNQLRMLPKGYSPTLFYPLRPEHATGLTVDIIPPIDQSLTPAQQREQVYQFQLDWGSHLSHVQRTIAVLCKNISTPYMETPNSLHGQRKLSGLTTTSDT